MTSKEVKSSKIKGKDLAHKGGKLRDIYDSYILHLNERKMDRRYRGDARHFHSSQAGLCARKHYFHAVEHEEPVQPSGDSLRLFRLGDVVHTDIQDAIRWWATNEGEPIFIEKEILMEKYGVKGFIDFAYISEGTLYDIKTCNSWKWKMMFGRDGSESNSSENYAMQIGTYGLWYNETHGADLAGLKLTYYKKDDSTMREIDISLDYIDAAKEYWTQIKDFTGKGIPPVKLGLAPVYAWECNPKYCGYYDICGGGINTIKKVEGG